MADTTKQEQSITEEAVDSVFLTLLSADQLLKQNDTGSNTVAIKLMNHDITTLKHKAFKQAFSEAVRYLFYVSYALVKGDVKPVEGSFTSSSRLFTLLSPALQSLVPTENQGLKTNLAFTLVNVLFEVIKDLEEKAAIEKANRVLQAFQGGYGRIDVDLLKEVAKAFSLRFCHQINAMSISLSTHGKLRLHERDGVVQFANVLAQRIGTHIMEGRNEFVEESNIAFLQSIAAFKKNVHTSLTKTFGEAQNVKARLRTPTLQRCLLATWQEIDGYDVVVEYDTIEKGQYISWPAGDIFTQTGIRDINKKHLVCERKDYFNSQLGYIYATSEEAAKRKFEAFHPLQPPKQIVKLSESPTATSVPSATNPAY